MSGAPRRTILLNVVILLLSRLGRLFVGPLREENR
jgi:hypothetical protein